MISILAASAVLGTTPYTMSTPREFRGAWVATVANIDWPTQPGLSSDALIAEMHAILDKAVECHLNAIVFQVRPSADALYKSDLEPWSWYLTREQGTAPADDWDPLAAWIEESHKRGIELHAWLNPYRAKHPVQKDPVADTHVSHKLGDGVLEYGDYLWMDPGDKRVQDHSFAVFMDLTERYDLDGLHIDDYFYPYPIYEDKEKVEFPDDVSWGKYQASGGKLDRNHWRRDNVNQFIERVYDGIKQRKPWVKFGISPFGIYRPGVPETIQAGIDQYDELFADAKLWLEEGWCDYYAPQLYWPIEQTPQSFPVLLDWWAENNPKNRSIWPGQFTSRCNPEGGDWPWKEVTDQIKLVREQEGADGTVHFSMKAIQNNWNGIADGLKKAYVGPALVPEAAWLGSQKPGGILGAELDGQTLKIDHADDQAKFSALYELSGETWRLVSTGSDTEVQVPESSGELGVALISRTGLHGDLFRLEEGAR